MVISDLNVLEVVEATEVVGGTSNLFFQKDLISYVNTYNNFYANSYVNDYFKKYADIYVDSKVKGNSSSFAVDNEAIGFNSNTQGTLNQQTIAGVGSSQNAVFVAASNY
jgi:hypothetical protein